jgi:TP901 family phage tail tape measure protein
MPNTTNKITVQVQQAIAAMNRLNAAFGQHAQTINQAATAQANFNQQTARQQGARQLTNNLNNATNASAKLNNQTLQTLEAFVRYNIINQVFNRITRGIRDATEAAKELQLAVVEARTLAAGAGDTGQEALTDSILAISSESGFGAAETANAVYQALSNQVGDLAESLNFVAQTSEFARATFVDLADAGDLIAGVMNAYGLELNNVQDIQDSLFRTIDLGRVTAEELATSFGVLTQPAATLGIEFDELNTALSHITISGVSSDRAMTGLRNVMFSLLKPSEGMQAALDEIGVSSVKAGISAEGFLGFLQKLQGTTGGLTDELADLFPNLRAFQGASALLSDGGDKLNETFTKFQDNLRGVTDRAKELVESVDATQLNRSLNQFRNVLTQEVGDALIQFQQQFFLAFGGAENAAKSLALALKTLAPAAVVALITGLGITVVRLGAAMLGLSGAQAAVASTGPAAAAGVAAVGNAAVVSTSRLAAFQAALGPVAAAATFGTLVGTALGLLIKGFRDTEVAARELRDRIDELTESQIRYRTAQDEAAGGFDDQIREQIAELAQQEQETLSSLNRQNAAYKRHRALVLAENDQITAAIRDQVNSRVGIIEEFLNSIINRTKQVRSEISSVTDFARGLDQSIQQTLFDSRLQQLDPAQQGREIQREIQNLINNAQKAFESGEGDQGEARLQRALQLSQQLLGIEGQRRAGEQALNRLQQASNKFLKQRVDSARELEASLQGQEVSVRQQVTEAKTLAARFNELGRQFADADSFDLAAQIKDQQAAVGAQLEALFASVDSGLLREALGENLFEQFQRDFVDPSTGQAATLDVIVRASADQLTSDLQAELLRAVPLTVLVELQAAGFAPGPQGIPTEGVSDAFNQQQTVLRNTGAVRDANNAAEAAADAVRIAIAEQVAELRKTADGWTSTGRRTTQARAEIELYAKELQGVSRAMSAGDLDLAISRLEDLPESITRIGKVDTGPIAAAIGQTAELTIKANEAGAGYVELSAKARGVLNLADAVRQATVEQEKLNKALREQPAGGAPRANGGSLFRANGGRSSGPDSVPAMLSPNEFVVNSRAASQFRSQLVAMNSGMQSLNRNNGGEVSNTTNNIQYGDININNPGRGVNARELAGDISREIRRNTVKL